MEVTVTKTLEMQSKNVYLFDYELNSLLSSCLIFAVSW